jgi:hypothetical protein
MLAELRTIASGAIGGFTLGSTTLSSGTDADYVALMSGGTNAIQVGDSTFADAKFSVTSAGILKATSGTVGGWTLGADSLSASSGTVGMSSAVTAGDDIRFWAGDATPGSAEFRVTESGALSATNVSIGAGGVTLDTSGLFISPVSASGGGAYANANAVRWTTDTTWRTALWRSDDTSTSYVKTFNLDHINKGNDTITTTTNILASQHYLTNAEIYAEGSLKLEGFTESLSHVLLMARTKEGGGNTYRSLVELAAGTSGGTPTGGIGYGTPGTGGGGFTPTITVGLSWNSGYLNLMATGGIYAKDDLLVYDNGSSDTKFFVDSATGDTTIDGTLSAASMSLTAQPLARVYKSADQTSISTSYVLLTWNTEDSDALGMHDNSTNNSRLTVPTGQGGLYMVTGYFQLLDFAAQGGGNVFLMFRKNAAGSSTGGTHLCDFNGWGGNANVQLHTTPNCTATLAAGDYVEAFARTAQGASASAYVEGGSVADGHFTLLKLF